MKPAPAPEAVSVADEQDDHAVDVHRWAELSRMVREAEGVPPATELSVRFVDAATITDLNERYLGGHGPTDVLAFPLDGVDDPPSVGPAILGDVVICPAVAASNAPGLGRTLDEELALLVVHGILHLLGHDHAEPEETTRMQERERELLARFSAS